MLKWYIPTRTLVRAYCVGRTPHAISQAMNTFLGRSIRALLPTFKIKLEKKHHNMMY